MRHMTYKKELLEQAIDDTCSRCHRYLTVTVTRAHLPTRSTVVKTSKLITTEDYKLTQAVILYSGVPFSQSIRKSISNIANEEGTSLILYPNSEIRNSDGFYTISASLVTIYAFREVSGSSQVADTTEYDSYTYEMRSE